MTASKNVLSLQNWGADYRVFFFRGQTALNLSSDDPKFLALTVSGTLNIQILEYEGV